MLILSVADEKTSNYRRINDRSLVNILLMSCVKAEGVKVVPATCTCRILEKY